MQNTFCKRVAFRDAVTGSVIVLLGLVTEGEDFIKIKTRSHVYEIKKDLILSIGDTKQPFTEAKT